MYYNIIIIILLLVFLIKNCDIKEKYMNYEQKRKYFECNYGNNANSYDCHRFFNEVNSIKSFIVDNPIGYVYNKKLKRPLLGWYDRYDRKYYYYVVDYNKNYRNNKNKIMHTITNNGKELSNKDVINVPNRGIMKVKIYEDVPYSSSTTIYTDSYAHPHRFYKNKFCWKIVGHVVSDKDDIYKLYESDCPVDYRYKIRVNNRIFLNVKNKNSSTLSRKEDIYRFRDKLDTDDIINIDNMKGDFKAYIYTYNDIY